jgi:arylsulfatase A-like enzyme
MRPGASRRARRGRPTQHCTLTLIALSRNLPLTNARPRLSPCIPPCSLAFIDWLAMAFAAPLRSARLPGSTVLALVVALMSTLIGGLGLENAAAAQPPNIVLIISDDQAWTDYSFQGHPHIKTPHLDKLARESLTFTRGYVPSSLCCPSLVSIITGLFPHQHGITSNDPPLPTGLKGPAANNNPGFRAERQRMIGLIDHVPTLPKRLAEKGYLSFQSGKWWQGEFTRGGFTHGMTTGNPEKGGRHGDQGLQIGRKTMQPLYDFMDLAQREQRPFFVWYAPMLPHDPHTPPERLLAKYKTVAPTIHVAKYWAMVEWFDETCGDLLGYLERQGLANDTVIAYVTDNGWIQDPDNPRYAPKSKQSPYDGGLRTPIMIRWPGQITPRMSPHLASSLDLAPTLLAAAGLPRSPAMPGIDLRDEKAVADRRAVFGECFTHNAVNIDRPASSLRWRWIVNEHWKLIVPAMANEPQGKVELFDLQADPFEKRNLAADRPEMAAALRGQLDRWWQPSE